MIDIAKFLEYAAYDPESGSFFWMKDKGRAKAGSQVGWVDEFGYRRTKFGGRMAFLHAVAWEITHGPRPDGFEIDHIDGNPSNNAIANLRLATKAENLHNTGIRKTNTSGVKGVNWSKHHGKYQVQVMLDRKKLHGGYFTDIQQAEAAARALREKAHQSFHRHV
jgi:hypothetical protein